MWSRMTGRHKFKLEWAEHVWSVQSQWFSECNTLNLLAELSDFQNCITIKKKRKHKFRMCCYFSLEGKVMTFISQIEFPCSSQHGPHSKRMWSMLWMFHFSSFLSGRLPYIMHLYNVKKINSVLAFLQNQCRQ